MTHNWILTALEQAQPFVGQEEEDKLIAQLLDTIDQLNLVDKKRAMALGAAFDLLVSAEYYALVAHIGWLYCKSPKPILIYPYTNTCPRCLQASTFIFHKANKPKSGAIGAATSRLLGRFYSALLERNGIQIEILRGREPVDAIFIDDSTTPTTVFFVEIKASPLVTLPLTAKTQQLSSESSEQDTDFTHRETDLTTLYHSELSIMLPQITNNNAWQTTLYTIGSKQDHQDTRWAYRGLLALLSHDEFFLNYLAFWQVAFATYQQRNTASPVYWLTNGCGQPVPRPADWPKRSGTGYESVSDAKTSVGMDRTDDIKKATYQVLKLGAEGKPNLEYNYKVGILSNIHAARHFDEYLSVLTDIVWMREETGEVTQAGQLAPETPVFNLFDGIVTLTSTLARDKWVKRVFQL